MQRKFFILIIPQFYKANLYFLFIRVMYYVYELVTKYIVIYEIENQKS